MTESTGLRPQPMLGGDPLCPGQRVIHSGRDQAGEYVELDAQDPSGQTVWVDFGDDDVLMVSLSQLDRPF